MCLLTDLPDELLQGIFQLLSAIDLVSVSGTCKRFYLQSQDEKLWKRLVNANLPNSLDDPGIFASFRDLYSAHHPYWFLPRNKVWFSDEECTGSLIISRYDNRRGVIEAFRLLAAHGDERAIPWSSRPGVEIQPFHPRLRLWLDSPVIDLRNPEQLAPKARQYGPDQFKMEAIQPTGLCSSLTLRRGTLGKNPKVAGEFLWPPATIPGAKTLRHHHHELVTRGPNAAQETQRIYETSSREISETVFEIRRWRQLLQPLHPFLSSRYTENVDQANIYATLDPTLYTPTKEKPFQGIWVGDYNFHKCEFLLFLQRDAGDPMPLGAQRRRWRDRWAGVRNLEETFDNDTDDNNEYDIGQDQDDELLNARLGNTWETASLPANPPNNDVDEWNGIQFQGRLEAIKLTGDPNVPRGELSFVAEDIGPKGLIGISHDEEFPNARIVNSKGHIAFDMFTFGELERLFL